MRRIGEGPDLHEVSFAQRGSAGWRLQHGYPHWSRACADHPDLARRAPRQIEFAAFYVRAVIVNGNVHRFSIIKIGDAHARAERKGR